jgi:hypothetical protein
MKCFKHSGTEAVGTCKYCQKGVCHQCVIEEPNGIACSITCAGELKKLEAVSQFTQKRVETSKSKLSIIAPLFNLLLGGIFVYRAVQHPDPSHFLILLGVLFIGIGVFYFGAVLKNIYDNK